MTHIDTKPSSPDPNAFGGEAAASRDGSTAGEHIRIGKSPRGLPELRVLDQRWPQLAAGVLAVVTGIGVLFWMRTARVLIDWCGGGQLVANCGPPPDWVRIMLLAVAFPGIAAGIGATTYLAYFAASGRTWRRWRGITYAFGGLVLLWLVAFVVAMIAKP